MLLLFLLTYRPNWSLYPCGYQYLIIVLTAILELNLIRQYFDYGDAEVMKIDVP